MTIHTFKSWRFWVGLAFMFLAASLPVAFYLRTYDSVAIKYTLMQLGAFFALTAWLAGGVAEERFEIPGKALPLIVLAAGLFIWNAIRFFASPYRIAALDGFMTQEIFLLSFMLVPLSFSEIDLKKLVLAAVGAWAVTLLYGLVQYSGLDPFIWKGAFGENIFSTIGNPDLFAAYLIISSPLALAVIADSSMQKPLRITAGLLSVIGGIVIVMTGAVPETFIYLAILAGFIMLALLRMEAADRRPAILAAVLAAAACIVAFALGAAKPTAFSSDSQSAAEIRRSSFEMAKKAGLSGSGPGSFWIYYPPFRSEKQIVLHHRHNIETGHAGNEPIEQWIEGGLVGMSLWLAIFAVTLYKGFKTAAPREFSGYACALFVSVAGSLAVSMISLNSTRNPVVGWLMYFNAGLLAMLAAGPGKPGKVLALPAPSGRLRFFFMAAVAAAGCWAAYFPLMMFRSNGEHNIGIFFSKNAEWGNAIEKFEKELPGSQTYIMGQYFIGNVLQDWGRPGDLEKAAEQYRKVRSLAPDYVNVNFQEAKALQKLNRLPEAIERLEKQVLIDPVWEEAWLALAGLYKETGNMEKAKEAQEKAGNAKALWEGRTVPAAGNAVRYSGGIGIKALFDDGTFLVEEVVINGPAGKAGIRPGDQILEISPRTRENFRKFIPRKFTPEQAARALTGPPETRVTVVILPNARRSAAYQKGNKKFHTGKIIQLQRARVRYIPGNLFPDAVIRMIAESLKF